MNFIPQNFWDCKGNEMFWNRKIILKKIFKCLWMPVQRDNQGMGAAFDGSKIPQKQYKAQNPDQLHKYWLFRSTH
jgi:hypothetical protein